MVETIKNCLSSTSGVVLCSSYVVLESAVIGSRKSGGGRGFLRQDLRHLLAGMLAAQDFDAVEEVEMYVKKVLAWDFSFSFHLHIDITKRSHYTVQLTSRISNLWMLWFHKTTGTFFWMFQNLGPGSEARNFPSHPDCHVGRSAWLQRTAGQGRDFDQKNHVIGFMRCLMIDDARSCWILLLMSFDSLESQRNIRFTSLKALPFVTIVTLDRLYASRMYCWRASPTQWRETWPTNQQIFNFLFVKQLSDRNLRRHLWKTMKDQCCFSDIWRVSMGLPLGGWASGSFPKVRRHARENMANDEDWFWWFAYSVMPDSTIWPYI